jgi:murein DD-endopeptidase MepM/ murein hydrolase activator NlpD
VLRFAASLLAFGMLLSGLPAVANADDLEDQAKKVKAELVQAKKDVASGQTEVKKATAALQASQASLKTAQSKLAKLQAQLADAKAEQAKIQVELEKAQAALEVAKQQAAAASAEVDRQRELITVVARAEFRGHNDLIGYSMILQDAEASDIANQLQWSSTIFHTTQSELDRLKLLEATSDAAEDAQAKAEAEVAAKNKAAKAQVSKIATLTKQAEDQAAAVAALVAANKKAKKAAESELEQSKKEYKKLQDKEAEIMRQIAAAANDTAKLSPAGFIYPVNAKPGSPFGMRYHPILHYWRMHWGQDFGAKCGAPLYAMADGKVTQTIPTKKSNGLGNYTIISYGTYKGKSISSGYAHQSKIIVKAGDWVKQGQVVGYVGTTGLSTGCHLHLQIYYGGARVNPMQFL